jgi:hypothetical protein
MTSPPTTGTFTLATDDLEVRVDAWGADIGQIHHRPSGTRLLFETPWAGRAAAIRAGVQNASSPDSFGRWLESSGGGWNTLCPNAGAERMVAGAVVGFHGEAGLIRWNVTGRGAGWAEMSVDLYAVPLRLERVIRLDGARMDLTDVVTNLSPTRLAFDYVSHPAFGADLLRHPVRLGTSARRFIADDDAPGAGLAPGSTHRWPWMHDAAGAGWDLRVVPDPGAGERSMFGYLEDFEGEAWASVTAPALDLMARLSWDKTTLPRAWWWQELGGSRQAPWFGMARTVAVEPASTPTSGPVRTDAGTMNLGPGAAVTVRVALAVDHAAASPPTPASGTG